MQERPEHIAEWVRLTEGKIVGASCAGSLPDGRRAGPQHQQRGINAAVRDLGIERTQAQRAVKIASLTPEAKDAGGSAALPASPSECPSAPSDRAEASNGAPAGSSGDDFPMAQRGFVSGMPEGRYLTERF